MAQTIQMHAYTQCFCRLYGDNPAKECHHYYAYTIHTSSICKGKIASSVTRFEISIRISKLFAPIGQRLIYTGITVSLVYQHVFYYFLGYSTLASETVND